MQRDRSFVEIQVLDSWIAAKQVAHALDHSVVNRRVLTQVEGFEPDSSLGVRDLVDDIGQGA